LIIQLFAENQRLIFDEKWLIKTASKNKNIIKINEKNSKNNKYDQNNDKMSQKRKIYKT
jgi:hypothetical protein